MKYNLYDLNTTNFEIRKIFPPDLMKSEVFRFNKIEEHIILEYLHKQEGKIGIKGLGNEIRYNDVLKNEFSQLKEGTIIIKATENRRSFIKLFLDAWMDNCDTRIIFFILENDFGIQSKLVDSSFIRISEVEEELKKFHIFFKPTGEIPKVLFVEFKGFEGYRIEQIENYSKLHKNE